MKKILLSVLTFFVAVAADAQYTYQDAANKDMLRHPSCNYSGERREIILPQVNGYTVFKADLHTHSMFSDGQTTPEWRVREAWFDGLDAVAITEHIEYRPYEKKLVEYLIGYVKKNVEAVNYDIVFKEAGNEDIKVDLNAAVRLAQAETKDYPVLVIPGTEITRPYQNVGHYNALFTTDNNAIPSNDPMQALRNAKAQGALVQHNHPGWKRSDLEMVEFEANAYKEKLIDGVETMNGPEFYPKAIDRALEHGLFVSANTDIHATTELQYDAARLGRNITFILAKERTLESLREALEARRTISYAFDQLAGEEKLLKALFDASVRIAFHRNDSKGRTIFTITNTSSIPYAVSVSGGNPVWVNPFATVMLKAREPKLTVVNMWCGENSHPSFELKF